MKRVLQVMGGLNRGGLETFAMNIYRAMDKKEIQFDFLLTQIPGGDYAEEAKSMGANIYTLPARNKGYKAYQQALDAFFKEHHDYIAIHEHISSLTSIDPAYYAKKYGIPVRIFHAHSSSIQKSLKFHWVHTILHYVNKPKVHSWATHYLGCSDKALDWVYKYTGVRSKAIMINNGIDTSKYVFDEGVRDEVRAELGIDADAFVMGHVGRFIPLKNQSFLIDILVEMKKTCANAKLMLVGDGDLREKVAKDAETKGVEKDVLFTGVRSDVNRLMQAMDVFVMPSWFEGLPVSLVEAQAAGLPVVASDTISHDSDVTGSIIFHSIKDTPKAWSDIILKKNNGERMDNTHKIILAGFDSNSIVQSIKSLYYDE